jgi:hypothetical protein
MGGWGRSAARWVQMIIYHRRWTLEEFKKSGEYDF